MSYREIYCGQCGGELKKSKPTWLDKFLIKLFNSRLTKFNVDTGKPWEIYALKCDIGHKDLIIAE